MDLADLADAGLAASRATALVPGGLAPDQLALIHFMLLALDAAEHATLAPEKEGVAALARAEGAPSPLHEIRRAGHEQIALAVGEPPPLMEPSHRFRPSLGRCDEDRAGGWRPALSRERGPDAVRDVALDLRQKLAHVRRLLDELGRRGEPAQ